METNKLYKNVFTPDQVQYLNNLIKSNEDKMMYNDVPERGRDALVIKDSDIDQSIKDIVLGYFDDGFQTDGASYSNYNRKYINPNLPPHKDPNPGYTAMTFDYQLSSNVTWPFCIEGNCHEMEDNDAVIFEPSGQHHWRPEQEFQNDEYVNIIFFYLKKLT
jgi:hypothetical protein